MLLGPSGKAATAAAGLAVSKASDKTVPLTAATLTAFVTPFLKILSKIYLLID